MTDSIPAVIDEHFGPAMKALPTDMMRAFVSHFVATGCKPADAALAAGYSASSRQNLVSTASALLHDPRIAAALREEQNRVVRADVPMALKTLRDICADKDAANRDRLKAAEAILNRAGMSSVQKHEHDVLVTHQTDREKEAEITRLGKECGWTDEMIAKAIGKAAPIDGEFTEITPEMQEARARKNELAREWAHRSPEEREAHNAELRAKQSLDGKLGRIAGALERGEITEEEAEQREFEARLGSIEPKDQNDLAPESME